jgi:hypothetical protein
MIQTGPTRRILVARKPVDFRKGMDGLAATCRQQTRAGPHDLLRVNRQGIAFKILLGPSHSRVNLRKVLEQRIADL